MKKYHQLLLLIVSVISLSLFLIYRHEYNRLHYVLEVFNFFGQPCNMTDLEISDKILNHYDWGSQPVWQETENGYIYSAFLTGKIEVKAIALSDQSPKNKGPRNCYLWFEDKKKAVIGKFKYSKLVNDDNSQFSAYLYICSLPNVEQEPFAVSFSFKQRKDNEMRKILVTNTLEDNAILNNTVCVSPSALFSKKRFLEFISFHKLIGLDTFIFYGKDIPHRLSKIVSNLSHRLGISISFFQFNYPKENGPIVRSIVETDCLLRTSGKSKYALTLELNEYLVPMLEINFSDLMHNMGNFIRFSVPVQKFCIDSIDLSKPIALQFFDYDVSFNTVRYIYGNSSENTEKTTVAINAADKGLVSLHKYVKCNLRPHKTQVRF